MKKYFAYIRVSTVKQGERGSSLQEQRSAIETFAQRNNLTIAEWFEERETAAKQGRRMFLTMLAKLSQGKGDGLIIHKIDRGARNLRDWNSLGEIIDRGVPVHFVHDNVDLQSRGGRLSADIQAVVAADYVRNLRDEVKKGFYGRLKQGFYPLGAPVGYLDCGGGKLKEVDSKLGPLVRQAFEIYAANRMSIPQLQEELTRRGLTMKRGGPISVTALNDLLRNTFYMGIIRIRRTNESFPGLHQPLISKKLFDRVQAVLSGKTHRHVLSHEFEFRKFIRCASCNRHLVGERKKRKFVYYRCYNRTCRKSVIKEKAMTDAFRAMWANVHLSEKDLGDLGDLAREQLAESEADTAGVINHHQLELGKCEKRLNRLTDALLDGQISKEVFEERRLASLHERQSCLDQLADSRMKQAPAQTMLDNLELLSGKQIGDKIPMSGEMRQIAESMCWNFVADGKTPAFRLRSPYREIAEWRFSAKGGPIRGAVGTRLRELLDILIDVAKREMIEPEPRGGTKATFLPTTDQPPLAV